MHNINIILIKKSEIRHSKINTILNNVDQELDIPYLELPQDVIAFPTLGKKDVVKHFGSDITFAYIETDYFGGSGEQSASLNATISNENISGEFKDKFIKQSDLSKGYICIEESRNIDKILDRYGVIRTNGNDEFDSIHLGKYRQNSDFLQATEYWKNQSKNIIDHVINMKSF